MVHSNFSIYSLVDGQSHAWPFTVFFTPKQVFGPRTAKSQPIWIIFCIHLLFYGVGRFRPRSARGRLQAKPEWLCFVILVTHPKSYIETTDRRDFGRKPSKCLEVRTGAIVKNSGIFSVSGVRSIKQHFPRFSVPSTILRTAYREQFYPESVIPETLKVWRVFDQTFNIT